ncbi:hypothetical protein FHW67_002848 [Herbaspirillum sp. Sphag1AN]|uniref:hypothetical protein n=1 Tax=unclassified Herbaspirillum TaxID=2624150 RepID=UPI001608EF6C|nr:MULTISPECIES: hypothetical protein [unclassified Herbaspirillum]MBB3213550.1 hypothetical protein [Herbaspirillum sp. Sphag1AN]MBB3246748.1 hypothetical protein [Herbaspirillum sp. Sphag64]
MISKKLVPALLISTVLAASVSNVAMAHDRNGLAIAAGIIGAVAAGTIIANSVPAPVVVAPQPVVQPVYSTPQVVYYQAPPAPVYYQPAPVYYRPAPVYVARDYPRAPGYPYYGRYYDR